jgi:hypothetical protein
MRYNNGADTTASGYRSNFGMSECMEDIQWFIY